MARSTPPRRSARVAKATATTAVMKSVASVAASPVDVVPARSGTSADADAAAAVAGQAPPAPGRTPQRIRLTLGIDEAGRGPAIGPMVMAAVVLDTPAARRLTRAGLADSKSYGAGDDA